MYLTRAPSKLDPDRHIVLDVVPRDEREAGTGRIRCPRCGWTPRVTDLWMCRCGCSWNTFETRGKCPDCATQWQQTQCLSCHQWSPHEDWHAEEPTGGRTS